jgi:hypothetical protein
MPNVRSPPPLVAQEEILVLALICHQDLTSQGPHLNLKDIVRAHTVRGSKPSVSAASGPAYYPDGVICAADGYGVVLG